MSEMGFGLLSQPRTKRHNGGVVRRSVFLILVNSFGSVRTDAVLGRACMCYTTVNLAELECCSRSRHLLPGKSRNYEERDSETLKQS